MISEDFQTALRYHQAGQLPEAEQLYRQILQTDPRHAHAKYWLGVIALQSGNHPLAIDLFSDAIRLDRSQACFHTNLGEAYRASKKLDQAEACCREALRLDPTFSQAHHCLSMLQRSKSDLEAALESCRKAILHNPEYAQAYHTLGKLLRQLNDPVAAQAAYERALTCNPHCFEVLVDLATLLGQRSQWDQARRCLLRALELQPEAADVHFSLGNVETGCRDWSRAIECYETALRLNPRWAAAETRLGIALQSQGLVGAAITHYHRALQLEPGHAQAHYSMGTALCAQRRTSEAMHHFEATLHSKPDHASAHLNLGACYQECDEQERALEHYERALEIEPDAAEAHYNRGIILLKQGDLERGWPEYHWRLRAPEFPVQVFSEPLWDGRVLEDQQLLVHAEQGFGDTLHFIRYLPMVRQRCRKVVVQVQSQLVGLLTRSGFNVVGRDEPLPPFDCQIPMMSLPGLIGTTLANIPADVPYLSAAPELVNAWQEKLRRLTGLRVGIAWKGSAGNVHDSLRSIPLDQFEPLAEVSGVALVNLQKHEGVEQLRDVDFVVHQLGSDWDEAAGPFMDTAAVIRNLDLVITADTAVAHLAGALGVDVWVALASKADWRWLRCRDDSPWYPTMRLFRQVRAGDWSKVFARMAVQLEQRVASK